MEGERVPLREARMTLAVQVWASAIGYGCGGPCWPHPDRDGAR
jgi:hypothetical protein